MESIVKRTLSEQIYTILKQDIINQNIRCGEKLTLKSLQERFNLSSTPIREAMNRLSQEGLIDHVTNVGAKVIILDEKAICEIYDFCSILDSAALKLSINSEKLDEFINKLDECIKEQEKSLKLEDIEAFKYHSDDFHDIFFKFADNSRLYSASSRIRSQLSILTNIYQNFSIAKSTVYIEHKNIAAAVSNREFDKAELLLSEHFNHAKKYLLENLV